MGPLELLPLVLAALLALAGLALVADGWLADPTRGAGSERRRHVRAVRHRGGEVAVGFGLLCAAAALAQGDRWRFGPLAMVAAAVLLVGGAALNAGFLAERLANRGILRRGRETERRRVGAADEIARRPHDRRVADRRDDRPSDRGAGPTE